MPGTEPDAEFAKVIEELDKTPPAAATVQDLMNGGRLLNPIDTDEMLSVSAAATIVDKMSSAARRQLEIRKELDELVPVERIDAYVARISEAIKANLEEDCWGRLSSLGLDFADVRAEMLPRLQKVMDVVGDGV